MDCGLWCVLSERRRHVERLWRRRLLVTSDERRARRRFLRLMRGFDAEDVEVLRRAVESGGREAKQCAPGPPMDERAEEEPQEEDSGLIPQIDRPMSMPYLCCKLWRWKDLQVDAALHRLEALPWCRFGRVTINNATVSCCNPYHYALWIRPEVSSQEDEHDTNANSTDHASGMGNGHLVIKQTPTDPDAAPLGPPPSLPRSSFDQNSQMAVDDALESLPSTSMAVSPAMIHRTALAWARLDRWERKDQVGESVSLTGQFAAVGLLAASVHDAQNVQTEWDNKNEVSFALIRQSDPIGSSNPEDVWLYNSGSRPLFICISSSSSGSSRSDTLRRLSSGYCVRVHKGEMPSENGSVKELFSHCRRSSTRDPALQYAHLIISVGKGWGPTCHRLYVTDTPCRYEVVFAP